MPERAPGPNETLSALLAEAGWSPRALAREINLLFGAGTVAATAPYHWRDDGRVPYAPVSAMAAHALSLRLGRTITTGYLWGGRADDCPTLLPSTSGMTGPWTVRSTRAIASDWLAGGLLDRRRFLAMSGHALANAVWLYLTAGAPDAGRLASELEDSSHPVVTHLQQSIPLLQRLDDAAGGAANLGYVGAQVRAAALVVHEGGHGQKVSRQLLTAFADLGQLAGWMAFDAGQHGLAQRYFLTALRAAHNAGYQSMSAHVLADMAFQAATRGDPADGIAFGEAAVRAASGGPASVKATVLSRLAYCYASAGRVSDFGRARCSALEVLNRRATAGEPEWLYFLTANHLDCQAGYALINLGRHQAAAGDRVAGRAALREGAALLRTGAYARPLDDESSQRRALFEGAWLALGYAEQGKLEDACDIGRVAMQRLTKVASPRSTAVLWDLRTSLRRRTRNVHVADFLPDLEQALATAT